VLEEKEASMKALPIAVLALVLALGGCQYLTPPPEVRAVDVEPISQQVNQGSGGTTFDASVTLEVTNNVDATLRTIQIGYFDLDGETSIASRTPALPMDLEIPVGTQVTIGNIEVPVASAMITHMYANDENALVRVFCSGVDAYDRELEWDADIDIGVFATDL
jgi:hypothetical protein